MNSDRIYQQNVKNDSLYLSEISCVLCNPYYTHTVKNNNLAIPLQYLHLKYINKKTNGDCKIVKDAFGCLDFKL
jgi:hypothetical protein